jgi:four helix bundle protein
VHPTHDKMSDYKKLDVWKAAHSLTLRLYGLTHAFPHEERFVIVPQIRRAATSIGCNLAEGSSRASKDFARFVTMALGSTSEVEYLTLLATDLGYLREPSLSREIASIARMLQRLRQSARR